MHHPVSGINSLIHFVNLASPVMSRLTSSFTCQLISIIITTLIIHHSFTLSLQAQNLPFQQIHPTLDFVYLYLYTRLPSWQRVWTGPIMLTVLFLVSHFHFLLVPWCGGLSWLPVSFLLHVKYTLSYRIVYWPSTGGLLHLVQRGGGWVGYGPTQSPPHCTKCNSPPINGQWTSR